MSFAYMGILLIAIALGFLIIMIGISNGRHGEQPPFMSSANSSNWIATKHFVVGWGLAVLSAFMILLILPYSLRYHTQEQDDYAFDWCYECSGLPFILGPELSIVFSILALAGLAIGIIMVTTKGRERIDRKT
jgi:hypothetical protein